MHVLLVTFPPPLTYYCTSWPLDVALQFLQRSLFSDLFLCCFCSYLCVCVCVCVCACVRVYGVCVCCVCLLFSSGMLFLVHPQVVVTSTIKHMLIGCSLIMGSILL